MTRLTGQGNRCLLMQECVRLFSVFIALALTIGERLVGAIERGLLVYLGAASGDSPADVKYMVDKVAGLRIFPNMQGKMSCSVQDVGGAVLVVSQFTLLGDVRRGRRPSFDGASDPSTAECLYQGVVRGIVDRGITVETGHFATDMQVHSCGDGPVTIQIDSRKLY